MEPALKKAKITGHFRVALKPQDANAQRSFKKFKKNHDFGKENIQVITINDDDDEDNLNKDHNHNVEIKSQHLDLNPSDVSSNNNNGICSNTIVNILGQNDVTSTQQQFAPTITDSLLDAVSIGGSIQLEDIVEVDFRSDRKDSLFSLGPPQSPPNKYTAPPGILSTIFDHDKSLLHDIRCEPHYAWDSFNYDREQELRFRSINYFDDGKLNHDITPHKRAELVDWLVQLQNMFELDHEPLYMAVKIADQYLMRKSVVNEHLQLLYMTSLLISAKFDERLPPLQISDLIQSARAKFSIKYTRKQLINLEVDILTTLNFSIRYPLSYGFLRRFARCTSSDKRTLNLARYILESSLLEYEMIEVLESKMAAGSLLLAFQMLHNSEAWTETAKFYTGYEQEELYPLSVKLNDMITRLSKKNSATRKKYSHECFMEVARVPPVTRPLDR